MSKYELTVVVSSQVEDEQKAEVLNKVKDLIANFGGTVGEVEDAGKKVLAYEIQKMKEAYYYFIHFESDTKAPRAIEDRLRIMDNVIRFLIVSEED